MNWSLRPERLDAYAMFEGKKDRHRYDFDATFIRQPRYEFSEVFSPALMKLDLRLVAESEATLDVSFCIFRIFIIFYCVDMPLMNHLLDHPGSLYMYVHRSCTSNMHEFTTLLALLNSALIRINSIS